MFKWLELDASQPGIPELLRQSLFIMGTNDLPPRHNIIKPVVITLEHNWAGCVCFKPLKLWSQHQSLRIQPLIAPSLSQSKQMFIEHLLYTHGYWSTNSELIGVSALNFQSYFSLLSFSLGSSGEFWNLFCERFSSDTNRLRKRYIPHRYVQSLPVSSQV